MDVRSEEVGSPSREPGKRLYSPQQIGVAAFIGTPLPACWMLAQNYMALAQRSQARGALIWGVLGTAALLAIAFILPEKFPKTIVPLAYSFALRELAKQRQGADFKAHLVAGGLRQSNWRVAGVAFAGLALVLVAFVVVVLLLPGSVGQ